MQKDAWDEDEDLVGELEEGLGAAACGEGQPLSGSYLKPSLLEPFSVFLRVGMIEVFRTPSHKSRFQGVLLLRGGTLPPLKLVDQKAKVNAGLGQRSTYIRKYSSTLCNLAASKTETTALGEPKHYIMN